MFVHILRLYSVNIIQDPNWILFEFKWIVSPILHKETRLSKIKKLVQINYQNEFKTRNLDKAIESDIDLIKQFDKGLSPRKVTSARTFSINTEVNLCNWARWWDVYSSMLLHLTSTWTTYCRTSNSTRGIHVRTTNLFNSISVTAFKAFFDSACISSIVLKQCSRSGLLSLGNNQKSHEAKSDKYGGCGTIWVEFLAKWSRRTSAVWDGALSWYKNHELSAQNIFWNGVEWFSWNANNISKVSKLSIDDFCALILWFDWRVARQLMLMLVWGDPSHQHVLCLLWSLYTTYKHFSAICSNHRRPSATFLTFLQLKFHSANKIQWHFFAQQIQIL